MRIPRGVAMSYSRERPIQKNESHWHINRSDFRYRHMARYLTRFIALLFFFLGFLFCIFSFSSQFISLLVCLGCSSASSSFINLPPYFILFLLITCCCGVPRGISMGAPPPWRSYPFRGVIIGAEGAPVTESGSPGPQNRFEGALCWVFDLRSFS